MASLLNNRIILDLRVRLYNHIIALDLNFYDRARTGDIVAKVFSYVRQIRRFLVHGLQALIINILMLSGTMMIIFALNYKLALISFLPIPIIISGTWFYQRRARYAFFRLWKVISSFTSYVTSIVNSIILVKILGREWLESRRFLKYVKGVYDAEINLAKLNVRYFPLMNLSLSLTSTLIMLYGGLMVLQGETTIGTVLAFLGYLWRVYGPIRTLSHLVQMYTQAETAYEKLLEVLNIPPSIRNTPDAVDIKLEGNIRVEDVYFAYADRPVLKGINLEIASGEVVGIVGPNGSGKTTLARLLTRLYDPIKGKIVLDGINLKKIKLNSLRKQIVMVPQEPLLLSGMIAFNIAYGSEYASSEEVLLVSKISHAHEFIMQLPLAYDTDVGEAGRKLSGGQKQMICIARALIRKPRILILDEAMSSIAVELEEAIIKGLLSYLPESTIIIISHRPSLMNHVNRVIEIRDGRIINEYKGPLRKRPETNNYLEFLNPRELMLCYSNGYLRVIAKEGLILDSLKAKLSFPLSYPKMVILYNSEGSELYIIRNHEDLDQESQKALLSYLKKEHGIVYIKRMILIKPIMKRNVLVILEDENGTSRKEVIPISNIVVYGNRLIIITSKRMYVADINSLSKDMRVNISSLALEAEIWMHE